MLADAACAAHQMSTDQKYVEDKERILDALDALIQLREAYKDVVAIPEVVTLHDITEYRLETASGVKLFKDMFDRETAQHVLDYFNGADYIAPEDFENTIVCAIQEHRQHKKKK
jgi:hypothetical protein